MHQPSLFVALVHLRDLDPFLARGGPEHIFHEGFVLFMCSIGGVFAYSRLSALILASVLTDAVIPLLIAILMDMPLMSSFRSIARSFSS